GVAGTTVRVFADVDARVNVVRTQALGDGFTDIDDMGVFAAERAQVDVRQTVLGAGETFTGLAGDLRGDASRIDIATRYLGHGDQAHDFNYIVRHHGQKTECDLQANGVLAGKSSKTLRGTIDLIRGAKGAQGNENETVLLVDDGVHNKTVPTILCNEDDVAGNHGATIGHIRDEQMFYLASRGLSREAAELMFVSAIMEGAAIDAPDDESRAAVVRLGETVDPGFAALFDE
ncbi:MAG: SufD family Fe-S cluster assembly protein, partial [Eggerthellaceae bacterium]|nr:SufD family Fe-S cluster assembly protein [Eggerthellaceae bacterium]